MLLYQIVITILLLVTLTNLLHNLRQFRRPLLLGPLPDKPPLVSVLIPARDEERNIARCLGSLLRQDYAHLEILVLDDDSSDRTAEIVAEFARRDQRVRLLRGKALPPGWHGKAYACQQLAGESRGEWLLFTDADTVHTAVSVSASLRAAFEERADLLTYIPRLETESFWEKVMLPLMAFFPLFLLPMRLISGSSEPLFSMALGPFLLFRAPFYWHIGGHEAVRQEITEDMVFGRLVKQNSGRLVLLDGTEVVAVRFYRNLGEIWRGLAKSSYYAFDLSLLAWLGLLVVVFLLFIRPYFFLYQALLSGQVDWLSAGLPLLQTTSMWLGRLLVANRLRLDRWPCFLHGLMILVTIGIVLYSIVRARVGFGTTWKGRVYSFDEDVLVHRGPRE
jgi:chlorobactene glucosyltransferase